MKSSVFLIFCVFLIACGSRTKDKNGLQTQINKTATAESFDSFFKKFESDSTMQFSRIRFPLKHVLKDEEGDTVKVIGKGDWKYTDFSKIKKVIIRKDSIAGGKVNITLQIEDTGINVTYFFVKQKGAWWLNAIIDESD